ncbi:hypothetical protein [Nitriliruptor alkaliphilus]|uniref:hypothetical protein n=1 Tax=Nitriliruptor alkaliphilus TaxID=427918 RepID=UPI0006991C2B|nr:hypothetical protein [Nitriliruptor alkaliphilus]
MFFTVADLLQLDVDLLFFDTTSPYFDLAQPDGDPDDDQPGFRTGKGKEAAQPKLAPSYRCDGTSAVAPTRHGLLARHPQRRRW